MTALAPVVWGSTYLVTTEFLPPERPLLAAVLRALPAGLLLLVMVRQLPRGAWWWKAAVLGTLNIGIFFALLFVAAYRLPGGIAATIGAIQPLLVAVLASRVLTERLTVRKVLAGTAGIAGVALLVLHGQSRLDLLGVLAALGGAGSMAAGVVLVKKWGQPASPLTVTSWQLIAGGMFLAPFALIIEGAPPALSLTNGFGYLYLTLVGTAVAYVLWFRGLSALPVSSTVFLGLLSPVVATLLGYLFLSESLSTGQLVGAVIVLASLVSVNLACTKRAGPARSTELSTAALESSGTVACK